VTFDPKTLATRIDFPFMRSLGKWPWGAFVNMPVGYAPPEPSEYADVAGGAERTPWLCSGDFRGTGGRQTAVVLRKQNELGIGALRVGPGDSDYGWPPFRWIAPPRTLGASPTVLRVRDLGRIASYGKDEDIPRGHRLDRRRDGLEVAAPGQGLRVYYWDDRSKSYRGVEERDLSNVRVTIPKPKSGGPSMPPGLATATVVANSASLTRTDFLTDARLGYVTSIARGKLDRSPGVTMGLAGSEGAVFVDDQGGVKATLQFEEPASHVDMLDVNGDGLVEFISRGGWGNRAALLDHQGGTVWTFGGSYSYIDDMCAGDVDGDGAVEFAAGCNGSDGIYLLDRNGRKRWRQPGGNVWHVEMVDANGDGRLEIVHSNSQGEMTVRDGQGHVLSAVTPAAYFSHFALCRWPTGEDSTRAVVADKDTIWLFDFRGQTVAQFKAPRSGSANNIHAVTVKLRPDAPEYLAALVEFQIWHRSVLYLFDPSGALVYQEVLPDACGALARVPLENGSGEALLVGGRNRVWQYRAIPGTPQVEARPAPATVRPALRPDGRVSQAARR
jgi:hypothetical protein